MLTASLTNHETRPAHEWRDAAASRARLEALSRLLDSAFRIPGTSIHVGADAILNVLPGVGTLAAKGLAAYLVWEARRLGVPTPILLRMAGNIGVDAVIGAVPVVGWVADVFWRSNQRNMALLREHLDRADAPGAGFHGGRPPVPSAAGGRS